MTNHCCDDACCGDEARAVATPLNGLPAERERRTTHTLALDGERLEYEAFAGTLLVDAESAQPAASVFYAAFNLIGTDGREDPNRPITFIFNGGPGSSTTYLLMGSIAPKRVDMPELTADTAPYRIKDNPYTALPFTDLVFIDAPGTGFSHVVETARAEVLSVDGDIAAFAEFIRRYCTRHNRWLSPKYVLGESYGTTRGAGLAWRLQEEGVGLAGLTMISNLLDFSAPLGSLDQWYIGMFPTYAAVAQYHGKAGVGEDQTDFLRRARKFAGETLRVALAKGATLPEPDKRAVAAEFARFTGLDEDYVFASDLRVPTGRFRKELLRSEGRIVGMYDGRVAGPDMDATRDAETFVIDHAYANPSYWATVNAYLRGELAWDGPTERRLRNPFDGSSTIPGDGWTWWHHLPGGTKTTSWWGGNIPFPSMMPDLAAAITHQPTLKVLVGNGLFDSCTPFFETEYDVDHSGLNPELTGNIAFTYYQAGHMLYSSEPALAKFVDDLRRFYAANVSGLAKLNEREV